MGGDPAKGSAAGEGVRPMYPTDYIELCRQIGQDAIVLGDFWTPIKQRTPEGAVTLLNDRSLKSRADLQFKGRRYRVTAQADGKWRKEEVR